MVAPTILLIPVVGAQRKHKGRYVDISVTRPRPTALTLSQPSYQLATSWQTAGPVVDSVNIQDEGAFLLGISAANRYREASPP